MAILTLSCTLNVDVHILIFSLYWYYRSDWAWLQYIYTNMLLVFFFLLLLSLFKKLINILVFCVQRFYQGPLLLPDGTFVGILFSNIDFIKKIECELQNVSYSK